VVGVRSEIIGSPLRQIDISDDSDNLGLPIGSYGDGTQYSSVERRTATLPLINGRQHDIPQASPSIRPRPVIDDLYALQRLRSGQRLRLVSCILRYPLIRAPRWTLVPCILNSVMIWAKTLRQVLSLLVHILQRVPLPTFIQLQALPLLRAIMRPAASLKDRHHGEL